jgi:hypothetical protein
VILVLVDQLEKQVQLVKMVEQEREDHLAKEVHLV